MAVRPGLSTRASSRLVLATMALAALVVLTCSVTSDTPELETDPMAGLLNGESWDTHQMALESNGEHKHKVKEHRRDESILMEMEEDAPKKAQKRGKKKRGAKVVHKVNKALNKLSKGKKHTKKAKKGQPKSTAVEKAMHVAANAKILAMSAQQKALKAAKKAKESAAKAAHAPMTKRGHEIVKRAQSTAHAAALTVQAARAAVANLMRAKARASKAILDAAGGKYQQKTGYSGQGGYFGAALRTAFHNGQLSERLKHVAWKQKAQKSKKSAFERGVKKGIKKGVRKGEKRGERKALPKAVKKAEKLLTARQKAKEHTQKLGKKAAGKAALKAAARKEASKVRRQVLKAAKVGRKKSASSKKKAAKKGKLLPLEFVEGTTTTPSLKELQKEALQLQTLPGLMDVQVEPIEPEEKEPMEEFVQQYWSD